MLFWEQGITIASICTAIGMAIGVLVEVLCKCMTKELSCLLTKVLSTIKDGLVRYCNTKTRCQQRVDSEELNKFVVIT